LNTLAEHIENEDFKSALNIGCGYCGFRIGFLASLEKCLIKVGIDIVEEKIRSWRDTDWVILQHDLNLQLPLVSDYFNVVVACDVVEHLVQSSGEALVAEMERVCNGVVGIFAPIGWLDTGRLQPEAVHSEHDLHKSSWYPEWFTDRGYTVEVLPTQHEIRGESFGAFFAHKHM
jgi:hypothetical protein